MNVLVAMSGGVDSSVAAALLVKAGHEVTGVTLKLWGGASDSGCCSVSDVEDARRVAAQLGMPHYVFNFADDFEARVVDPYVAAYAAGTTPNPCVACNDHMKFDRLLTRATELGFDAVATGHHVRRIVDGATGRLALHRAVDAAKDQSYVLYMLGQAELALTLFPVGHLTKAAVREHARRLGLRTADKAESMDVCFITKGGRERFLADRGVLEAGPVVDGETGAVVGTHAGIATVTIGQRRGLAVAQGERRYVVDVLPAERTVVIGPKRRLLVPSVKVGALRFVDGLPLASGTRVEVQARAHGVPVPARIDVPPLDAVDTSTDTSAVDTGADHVVVSFDEPQPRIAPGQVVAFYDGDRLLGGGIARQESR